MRTTPTIPRPGSIFKLLIAQKRNTGLAFIGLTTLVAVLLVSAYPEIPQPLDYHMFADQRPFLGIPHFLNVLSNIAFVVVGSLGLVALLRPNRVTLVHRCERWHYLAFYLGAVLTGAGSAYYHLYPDNAHLFWDRLAMTVAFMSLLSSIISERISIRAGLLLLVPFLIAGGGSVVYWIHSENNGMGDLRPYIFVQFYPMLLILIMMLFFQSRYTKGGVFIGMMIFYALAKVTETYDREIFTFGQIISGHTLKHLLAAMAVYLHLRMLSARGPRVPTE